MVVCAEPFSKKGLHRAFLGGVSIVSLSLYIIMASHVVAINRDLSDYTSGIPVVERNKTLLPVRLEDYQVGKIRPLHWAFNYYNVFKGGATGQSVVKYTGRVPIKYKQPIAKVFPSFNPRAPGDADMERIKASYDYVLFWGTKQRIFDLFENNGFQLIHKKGRLRLYSSIG